ncbi:hypothetical protein [Streptomyces sp. HC307]|uniref:hypothetical protein n=1 Tax=Streptomyces flavusporus TaxID=3385496 RepID=UPI003917508E
MRLQWAPAAVPLPRRAGGRAGDARLVLAVDAAWWLRPDAHTPSLPHLGHQPPAAVGKAATR